MILYHASTMYHLLCFIVHKLAFHREEESRLLIVEYILMKKDTAALVERLNKQGWFSRIDVVPERRFKLGRNAALTEKSTPASIERTAGHISGAVEKWLGEDVRRYDQIYVAADHWSFGVYLLYHKIPYVYMEDASGMLSQEDRYRRIVKAINETNYRICEYYGGAGRSDQVKYKLCDLGNQQPGFQDPKARDFTVYDTLKNSIPDFIEDVLAFYGVTPIRAENKTCLFLSQYVKTLAIREIAVQELLTVLLADYMCPDYSMIVKPHPKDLYVNYHRLFGERCIVLPASFPSEILPFVIDRPIDLALTASSTSVGGVMRFAGTSVTFGPEIETGWEDLHPMYAAAAALKLLEFSDAALENINVLQMGHMLNSLGLEAKESPALIDGGLGQAHVNMKGCQVCICLSLGKRLSYPDAPREQVTEIAVEVLPERDSMLRRRETKLYVWCKDSRLREKLARWSEEKRLNYSKATVRITARHMTKEMERRAKLQAREEGD